MEARPLGSNGPMLRNQVYNADEGTLDALGARLIAGRNFTREETDSETLRLRKLLSTSREVDQTGKPKDKITQDVIISRAFGELAFKERPFLGRQLEDTDGDRYNVVGVIDRFYNPYGWPIHEYAMFFPGRSSSYDYGNPYLLRVEPGRMGQVRAAIEKTLLAVDPGRNVKVKPLTEIKEQFHSQSALMVRILTLMIFLLVFVTSLGIVGLTVFSVAERTRQIGTRRALGAQRMDILRYFLLENWIVTAMGLLLGVVLAYGLNVALVTRLNGTRLDPFLIAAGVLLLWIAGLTATWFPALRGSRVAPAVATRNI
jgi:putative ABC transport system permease protein